MAKRKKASQTDKAGAGAAEWREGERSEPDRNAAAPAGEGTAGSAAFPDPPDPEVLERPARRRFSTAYKLRVLGEADGCARRGEIGALLRREGLYSSQLDKWRKQRASGALEGGGEKSARRRKGEEAKTRRILALERETRRLRRELRKAEIVIDVQKKLSELLGIPLDAPEDKGRP